MEKGLIALLFIMITAVPAMADINNTSGPWGISVSVFPNLSTAISSPITHGKTIIVDKAVTVNNITIPGDISIEFKNSGHFLINAGNTININGNFIGAPDCIKGNGSIVFNGIGKIYPSWFTGTDVERVQKALDTAMNHNYATNSEFQTVSFDKIYDITGSTLYFKKSNASNTADRRMLYLEGSGGGIKKTDAGYVFDYIDATQPPTASVAIGGDITVRGLKFISTTGAGTTVYNSDKLIRVAASGNTYRGVDTIAAARGPRGALGYPGLAQSLTFSGEYITGGRGWVWEFVDVSDISIDKCLVEYRGSGTDVGGFRNYQVVSSPATNLNSALRITNNVIEGVPGTAIRLGACTGTIISGNYFENNYSDIDLNSDSYLEHYGVSVIGNFFNPLSLSAPDQAQAHIQWGRLGPGAVSIGNFSSGQPLHWIGPQVSATGGVLSLNDYGTIHPASASSDYIVAITDIKQLKTSSGTWTPTLVGSVTAGSNSYAIRTGTYYKIGNKVDVTCTVALSAKDAAMAGNISIIGLPFSSGATYYPATIGQIRYTTLTAGKTGINASVLGSEIKLTEWVSGGAQSDVTATNITNNTYYNISATYIVP